MGINQLGLVGPRAEQKQEAPKKKDWIDRVLEGLEIAKGVTGITSDYQDIMKARAERDAIADARAGIITKKAGLDYTQQGMQQVPAGTAGAMSVKVREGDDVKDTAFIMPKKTEDKGPLLEKIETTDAKGNPIIQFVEKKAGAQYPAYKSPKTQASGDGTNNAGAKKVSGEVAQNIGKYDAAMSQIDSLEKDWIQKTGTFSGFMQYLPGTDAAQYTDSQKLAAQNIGQIIEGGKLTDTDFDRYLSMMPTAGDSRERAAEKFAQLKQYVAERKTSSVDGARQAGYDVSGFTPPIVPPARFSGASSDGKAIAAPSSPPSTVSKGTVEDGYEFLGGDPGDPKNWRKVTQ